MKVNMTPNPLDVVTIHASQGDTEARQWEFELHNNGELIDTSEVKEQLVFKAYKGGTEQLLPENGSTPTTSPFKGDIKYPQWLLTDQEFLYRESPTEEDGLAKITDIKGNTLKWNQICIVPYAQTTNGITFTKEENGTVSHISGTASSTVYKSFGDVPMTIVDHVYYVDKGSDSTDFLIYNDNGGITTLSANRQGLGKATASKRWYYYIANGRTIDVIAKPMIFDLTAMFGETKANEILAMETAQIGSGVAYFKSLFPLDYYSYNQGSLLSFNGSGIKTVGKNLFNVERVRNYSMWINSNKELEITPNNVRLIGVVPLLKGKSYTVSYDKTKFKIASVTYTTMNTLSAGRYTDYVDYTSVENTTGTWSFTALHTMNMFIYFATTGGQTSVSPTDLIGTQVEIGTSASSYESYQESTLSLPISTYFPTGMKSAGTVYDELTESKAITRVGAVDLGNLTWDYISEIPIFQATITGGRFTRGQDLPCGMYSNSGYMSSANMPNMTYQVLDNGTLWIKNTSYTSASAFKTAMSGVYLYYELATPTETSFTTASLVTENAEIPLSNEDGVLIGKCTEELSAEPGFHDAKIKLADADGECYSNKIQLHIERSPQ